MPVGRHDRLRNMYALVPAPRARKGTCLRGGCRVRQERTDDLVVTRGGRSLGVRHDTIRASRHRFFIWGPTLTTKHSPFIWLAKSRQCSHVVGQAMAVGLCLVLLPAMVMAETSAPDASDMVLLIPEDASEADLKALVVNKRQTDEVRLEALARLSSLIVDESPSDALVQFYSDLVAQPPSEAVRNAAFPQLLGFLKARDGHIAGVDVFIQERWRNASSPEDKEFLAMQRVAWRRLFELVAGRSTTSSLVRSEAGLSAEDAGDVLTTADSIAKGRRAAMDQLLADTSVFEASSSGNRKEAIGALLANMLTIETASAGQRRKAIYSVLIESLTKEVRSLLAGGHTEQAVTACRNVMGRQPRSELSHAAIRLLMEACQFEDAARGQGEAIDRFLRLFDKDGPHHEYALFHTCLSSYQAQDLDVTLQMLQDYVAAYPQGQWIDEALMMKALCAVWTRQFPEALETLTRLAEGHPDSAQAARARFLIGWIHLSKDDHEPAGAALRLVVQKYPDTPYAEKARKLLAAMESR